MVIYLTKNWIVLSYSDQLSIAEEDEGRLASRRVRRGARNEV